MLTLNVLNSSADFQCIQPKQGYAVDDEWITANQSYPETRYFDVAAVLASDESYERFVSQLRPPCKVPFPNGDVFLCGGNGNGVLQISGIAKTNAIQFVSDALDSTRVIFTPSFSRYQPGRSQCLQTLGKKLLECENTVGVLMVREDEFSSYHVRFGKEWFVMAPVHVHCKDHFNDPSAPCCGVYPDFQHTPQATIGQARNSIMNVARYWRLALFWMIDDSVPVDSLQKCSTSPTDHQQISMLEVLEEVETFAVTKRLGEAGTGPLALLGIPSTYSVRNSLTFEPQWNHRTATSFVYVSIKGVYGNLDPGLVDLTQPSLNYDPRLPYKEDVVFAASLIKSGRAVCIYRPIHFKDKILDGGCQQYRQV